MAVEDDAGGRGGELRYARIDWTDEGSPRSTAFDDIYFSPADGLAESRHVFLRHNALETRWERLAPGDDFVIGETGFGTGLNFLAAWALWTEVAPEEACLHVFSVEVHPLSPEDLARALAAFPSFAPRARSLVEAWPSCPWRGLHRLTFADGRVRLTLALDDVEPGLEALLAARHPGHRKPRRGVDAWFLDGFSPARNPAMWRPEVLARVARLSAPDATFATFTAAGTVRRCLEASGFSVHKAPGHGRKRDMLHGRLERPVALPSADRFPPSPHPDGNGHAWWLNPGAPRPAPSDGVVVVGGGLAGCHVARALAVLGHSVRLIEADGELAAGGSGNRQGVLYARLSAHDSDAAHFNLAALAFAQRHYAPFWANSEGRFGEACGVLHLATDAGAREGQRALAQRYAENRLFRILDKEAAERVVGVTLPGGGLWFPDSGWLAPPALCRALAAHARIELRQGRVVGLERDARDGVWTLSDERGATLAETSIVILACAGALGDLEHTAALPVQPVRGQVSELGLDTAPEVAGLGAALCGRGYVAPPAEGGFTFGASFVPGDRNTELRREEHAENLDRLRAQVPGLVPDAVGARDCTGRAALRCATPDRLPMAGPVPNVSRMARRFDLLRKNAHAAIAAPGAYLPGLFASAGYGSRGLAYIPLATEGLVADVMGQPSPYSRSLQRALSPARFILRDLAKGRVDRVVATP